MAPRPIRLMRLLFTMPLRISLMVVVLTTTLFLMGQIWGHRTSVLQRMQAISSVLGDNLVSAISFNDGKEIRKILSSTKQMDDIIQIDLFDGSGNALYRHRRDGAAPLSLDYIASTGKLNFRSAGVSFSSTIVENGRPLAVMVITSSLVTWWNYLWGALLISLVGGITALLLAFGLALRFQRMISHEFRRVTIAIESVSLHRDLSVSVAPSSAHVTIEELDRLIHEFNGMLETIRTQDQELRTMNASLEDRVEERTRELVEVQKIAVINAHSAGMSEVASNTLHNIGNVLNSLNVSVLTLTKTLETTRVSGIKKLAQLLSEEKDHLMEFFTTDERAKLVPDYVHVLNESWNNDSRILHQELSSVNERIDMMKEIIRAQQTYAKSAPLVENALVSELIEDALKMCFGPYSQSGIMIRKEWNSKRMFPLQRNKLLHVLVNVINNARQAILHHNVGDKVILIRTHDEANQTIVEVSDTGMGILPEHLASIFTHGFTTKRSGHGFGLHYCANVMKEMGGEIRVSSDGAGQGATFSLIFNIETHP